MVDAVSSVGQTAAQSGTKRLAESFDTFLNLLTTQLKNQDPLSPLDSNQFTQQLVQMTGVEQQLYGNQLMEKLVANTGSGISTAVALIGRDVKAGTAENAIKDGKATWNFNLNRAADDLKLEVIDSKGRTVYSEAPADMRAGDHTFKWNGKDTSGKQLDDGGPYSLRVTAKDSAGTGVISKVSIQGVVTGVEQVDGKTLITINGAKIPWETVTSINEAAPTNTANNNDNKPTPDEAAA
ncbi:MAG: flagellar hook assembly protein FlgD [Phenylobacterium sp.]|uniref:flagellar hook assembly protein FlgD n=1 Tax=Phenylobacterium sp. TaxID=1871053 RepID=UPI0027158707|nr:flagellar hook assembly protein FlgD [Phenylobacterium sp.]MDO8912528.1 flagellar hook assembly protein FlgD [Phenylobacterium sp.]MDP2011148.1 flagellar hook assembly protein FlgD [Phenylobacterium sp.]MDP3101111.1 flagellar hook assembly protein FlgD [Phenylobacterium sp.]MDP3870732.1 flagellar hook assembly protein FlgD [Phenylobacterium sp.]